MLVKICYVTSPWCSGSKKKKHLPGVVLQTEVPPISCPFQASLVEHLSLQQSDRIPISNILNVTLFNQITFVGLYETG